MRVGHRAPRARRLLRVSAPSFASGLWRPSGPPGAGASGLPHWSLGRVMDNFGSFSCRKGGPSKPRSRVSLVLGVTHVFSGPSQGELAPGRPQSSALEGSLEAGSVPRRGAQCTPFFYGRCLLPYLQNRARHFPLHP